MLTPDELGRFAREDIWSVLHGFGITRAARAVPLDETEEVIVVPSEQLAGIDLKRLEIALGRVLPGRKVWVAPEGPAWKVEAL